MQVPPAAASVAHSPAIDPRDLKAQPLERATALPAQYFTDSQLVELERDAVFATGWQLAASEAQLCEVGDHVPTELAATPLLLVRGDDRQLHALHNVCRHRAGPLASCAGRGARQLRCKYHGWTYALDGQLRSAPEMSGAEDFDIAQIRLPRAGCARWQGLVFAALRPEVPFSSVIAGIGERIGERGLADYLFDHRLSYDIACNWKVYVDNYLEGYHVPHIHPALNRMLDYRSYSTEIAVWHSLQFSPLESAPGLYGSGDALYYYIYPNTMLNILPGRLQTNRVIPLGVDRCRVEFDFFYSPEPDPNAASRRASDATFSDEVQLEDVAICEAVQRGLASGSYRAGRLNPRRESGVHHFHELLRSAYRDELSRRRLGEQAAHDRNTASA